MPGKRAYRFGPYRLDAGDHLLYRDCEAVPLPPKAIDTLLVLVANHGRVVEKDELLKSVWPDTVVEEGGLARNVSLVRKALGDDGGEPVFIETIPKRGYRFIAPVEEESEDAARPHRALSRRAIVAVAAAFLLAGTAATWWFVAGRHRVPARRITSIAVLPLKNLSNDPSQDYFSAGVTEMLTADLTKIRNLHVVSPGLLKKRRVDAVVEGTVLRSADRIRITARLTDTRTGELLWAESYERDLSDVLSLQNTVATAIAREIRGNLSEEERRLLGQSRPVKREAYDLYLKGRYAWNRRTEEGFNRAIGYFQQAAKIDPSYALAQAGLADAYALLGSTGYDALPPAKVMPLAKAAALRALDLEPALAEARTTLAYVALVYDWDFPAARANFRAAIEMNPSYATAHHWYAHYWLATGHPARAIEEVRRARELDPLSLPIMVGAGWCQYFARNYDAAIASYREALDMEPGFALAHQTLGMAYLRKGMTREALAELEKAATLSSGSPSTVAALGAALASTGDRRGAERQLDTLRGMAAHRYVPAILFASVYAGFGDRRQLRTWLQKAVQERSEYLIYLRWDPAFEPYLHDPALAACLPPLTPSANQ